MQKWQKRRGTFDVCVTLAAHYSNNYSFERSSDFATLCTLNYIIANLNK
jgi:hypothetical protein